MERAAEDSDETDIQNRIDEYNRFIDTVVRKDFDAASEGTRQAMFEIDSYNDLKSRLLDLRRSRASGLTVNPMVNLGYEKLFCHAHVPDPSILYVHVGLGFHIELSIPEAIEFVDGRLTHLNALLEHRRRKEEQVLSHLRKSEAILAELKRELRIKPATQPASAKA
jgi:prefoldin subunit 5